MEDPAHRPIELQSPEDLTYLIENVRRAAADSINAAFPPVEGPPDGQEDELRNRIEQLVNDVCFLPSPQPQPIHIPRLLSTNSQTDIGHIVHPNNIHPRRPKPNNQRPTR
jgi:hypothetical protein